MTLLSLRDDLRVKLGVPASDALFTDAVCTDLLNNGVAAYSCVWDWPWLEASETINLVAATSAYSPAAAWRQTVALQYQDYPPLKRMDIEDLRQIGGTGRSFAYAVYAEQLHIRPVPTSTEAAIDMTHLYIKNETPLSADGDSPLLPAVHQWIVVEYAAYLGFRRSGQLDKAAASKLAYDGWIETQTQGRPSRYSEDMGGGALPVAVAPEGK